MTNPVPTKGPIESKVKGATAGSGAGVIIVYFVLWLLDTYVFKTTEIPDPVVAIVSLIPIGLTFLGGYISKHTARNDLQARGLDGLDRPPSRGREWTDR
jgi:hypothetical protein